MDYDDATHVRFDKSYIAYGSEISPSSLNSAAQLFIHNWCPNIFIYVCGAHEYMQLSNSK